MSQTVTLNGVSYTVPDPDDTGWGAYTTSYLTAIASNMLQKSGGSFNLTADADFGSTYGLVSGYFKSASSNIAGSGAVRLSNTDSIAFRNAGNSGDVLLSSDGTTDGILNYNSVPLVTLSAVQTLTAKTLTSPKLNEDVALTATSTYLNRVDATSSIQTQLDAKQATIDSSSRLSATLVGDNGNVSNTEFGYLAAVTSDIQTQLDAKQATINTSARLNANLIHDGTVSNTEFGYINTLSSNAQTQLNAKQATIDSTARLNADLIHDGSVSNTEFGHISTLSSNAQDQIDSKAPISNPNFTGYQDFNTISAPGAPGTTGQTRVYSTDGKLFFHGNGGAETEIGAGGGVGSIDTLFTIQAKSADAASDASGDDYCFRGAAAAITSAPTQDTTAGRLIHDEKVFKYTSATNSTNDWWLYSKAIAQGYQGKNVVIQLQYYMMETTGDNLNNAFRFVARDATNGKVTQLNGAVSSSNTLTLDAFADGDFTVGDRVTFVDTSNNIIFRYITSVTHASEQLTISGAAVSIADNAYFVSGILTDELDYLSVNKQTTYAEAKAYKKQILLPSNCDTIEFGFHYLGTQTDQFLYYDDIALSANQFLQVSSQGETKFGHWHDLNGFGSANTKIPYFGTEHSNSIPESYGTVVYSDGANGFSYTANFKQTVVMQFHQYPSAVSMSGISLNSTQLTTSIGSINYADRLAFGRVDAASTTVGHTVSVVMNKSDVIRPHTDAVAQNSAGERAGLTLTVTPEVSSAILLNSQDEIWTDWTDAGAIQFTSTGGGSPSLGTGEEVNKVLWRRDGSDMLIKYSWKNSSGTGVNNGSGDYLFQIPGGYSIDTSKINVDTTGADSGADQFENSIGHGVSRYSTYYLTGDLVAYNSTTFRFAAMSQYSSGWMGSGYGYMASTYFFQFNVRVPIQGWTSSFNPVLSMPLVDFGTFENTYAARVTSGGSITSQTGNFLSSVSVSSGVYTVVFTSGFFNEAPSVVGTTEVAQNFGITSVTASGFTYKTYDVTYVEGLSNRAASFTVTRQGADYRQPPQPTAAVIKPAVAIIEEQKTNGSHGGNSSSASYMTRECNIWKGETWFVSGATGTLGVSGSNTQFDLEAGTYKVEGFSCTHKTDGSFTRFMSTDSSVIIDGVNCYATASTFGSSELPFQGTFTITESKTFQVKSYGASASTTYGGGVAVSASGRPEIYMSCKIEKLK